MSRSGYSVKVFLLILLFFIPTVEGQEYGEDSTALGQFVDDFSDENYVASKVNVIHNSTLEVMELNYSVVEGLDFSTFTEVDSEDDISVIPDRITWSGLDRNSQSWVVFDGGVDAYGTFEYNFTLAITDMEAGDSSSAGAGTVLTFASGVGTFADLVGGTMLSVTISQNGALDDRWRARLLEYSGGVSKFSVFGATTHHTGTFYCTFNKTGADVWLWVYSDSARTVLIETVSDTVNGVDDSYRYIYGMQSWDSVSDPNDHYSGFIEDLTDGSSFAGYASSGYFTTEDYIDFVNGSVLVDMNVASIPANTAITVQYSEDNSTWVDSAGLPGYESLTDGFSSFDLRALNYSTGFFKRVNETTDDSSVTPFFNQSRLISTDAGLTVSGGGEGLMIVGLAIGLIIGAGILLAGGKS